MALKLVDIDDRLIHGQIATTWIPDFGIESAIIVSDVVAADPIQKSVAGLAVPQIKVTVFSTDKFIEVRRKQNLKRQPWFFLPIRLMHSSSIEMDLRSIT